MQYIAPGVNTRGQVVAGNLNWGTQIQGTDVDLPLIRSWPTAVGAFFSPADVASAAKVAVLGSVVHEQLFGADVDPVGQIIRINNQPFTVVGVMSSKGQSGMGQDQDDVVYVPYTTVMKKLRGITYVQNITVSAASAGRHRGHRRSHCHAAAHAPPDRQDEDDFMVRTMEEMASVRVQATETMTALLASIAGVSLLVGGIGIMNIMLVSVTERTREIGLRLAIGARGRDVLMQFLVEAIVLSMVGGVDRHRARPGPVTGRDAVDVVADQGVAGSGGGRVRLRRRHRRVLRLLPRPQGRRARPDRCVTVRVGQVTTTVDGTALS